MTIDSDLRDLIREAAKLAIRDEVPSILREQLRDFIESQQRDADPGPVLSSAAAARYADVSAATIRAWVSSGQLRAQHAGRVLKVRKTDLDAFLARAAPRGEGVIDLSERAREILSSSPRRY